MEITREAPKTLSDTVRLVVECGRKLDHEVYYPNAGVWHRPVVAEDLRYNDGFLRMSASSVPEALAGVLGVGPHIDYSVLLKPGYPEEWSDVLLAADMVRAGCYDDAAEVLLGVDDAALHKDALVNYQHEVVPICSEFLGWDEFDKHLDSLETIAVHFESMGL